ncbi:MAG: class I SAM-dependent methyltransferase [Chloroflexota bacterium]|nr:MAG: class I SAM-dependent methyltransferase [Chloroflexota bacterium]
MLYELRCPVCRQADAFSDVERFQQWTIRVCQTCGLQFADPLGTTETYYEETRRKSPSLSSLGRLGPDQFRHSARRWAARSRRPEVAIRWLREHVPPGAIVLDVGCGAGLFLPLIEQAGFVPIGIEISETLVNFLRAKEFRVHLGSVEDYPAQWPQPQAIMVMEVIEHVPDPVGFLRAIRQRFPTVPLLLSTPSPRSWAARLGVRPAVDWPPNHLLRWSEQSLRIALQSAGYNSIELSFGPVLSQEIVPTFSSWLMFRRVLGVVPTARELSSDERSGVRWIYSLLFRFYPTAVWLQERFLPSVLSVVTVPMARLLSAKGLSCLSVDVIAR